MDATARAFLDPLLDSSFKGYPRTEPARRRSELAAAGWNLLAGDLTFPVAVLKHAALTHNVAWMQAQVGRWGIDFAPHGKTTMSPQLFRRQLDAGAWGMTVATVTQLAVAFAAGARRVLVANQVLTAQDLDGIRQALAADPQRRAPFLLDSQAQLALIDQWRDGQADAPPFEVLLEVGVAGARTGCRTHEDAMQLARAARASRAIRLVGVECYEGQGATGDSAADAAYTATLLDRVDAIARGCVAEALFETHEILVSAGGSAIYDLVAARLKPDLGRPVRGLLRSGCYLTHDHGTYQRFQRSIDRRLHCAEGESLRPAMEVWAVVQSRPEPGLAILAMGKRDISFDLSMPIPIARAAASARRPSEVPGSWEVSALNDQHGYLCWKATDEPLAPAVGERIAFGVSHPCTTFDKWRWMPLVDADYTVVDAALMHF